MRGQTQGCEKEIQVRGNWWHLFPVYKVLFLPFDLKPEMSDRCLGWAAAGEEQEGVDWAGAGGVRETGAEM